VNGVIQYFSLLSDTVSSAWNNFWFSRQDPYALALVRIVAGIVGLFYALSFSSELAIWFADRGVVPVDVTANLTRANDPTAEVYYWSLFNFANDALSLYVLHGMGILVILLMTLGFKTRITSILSALFVISYALRAPMLTGMIEPLLCPVLVYLCLAPSGAYLSIDSWLAQRKQTFQPIQPSLSANIVLRLLQVHVTMFYLMLATSKLSAGVWWNGEAMWWIIAQPENRIVDLTFLRGTPNVVFAWTHWVVLFEFAFAFLIWVPILRPLLGGLALLHWILLALATGHWEFAILLAGLTFSFAPWQVVPSQRTQPSKTATSSPTAAHASS